ncbi:ABC transporter [Clostridium sulfidigenes]|uniref:ABC transporter n=1 Tax=Clostridium sulfidigenes TaxID=318464 RepID=A0A084J7W9_9CLOT|nr:ABC transporter permease [Clostridium sulfidigenes]KEZ85053.1 ABC transporter [Clostridium sulfidigenes]
MYSKIALNNVKKSFKDYTIYFLTLTFAVCIFYSFNSIESQKAMFEISKKEASFIDMLTTVISWVSVFVSVILGGLIVYANNFMIKRRKKELGVYMTLGMSKRKISSILVSESFFIGLMSLVAGLIFGIVLSQGLSLFTAKLFQVGMSEYKFVFSQNAAVKTIAYFGIMFLLIMIFNTFVISKYKLIDMINASKKSENIKIKNPIVSIIIFILGVGILITAYKFIIEVGLDITDSRFTISIILGILGTILFYYGLAGFILYVIKNSKKIYLKKLNIFVTRQISSKINTNFVSITVICLMLFITISILSTGLSFKNSLESSLKDTVPFDVSARIINFEGSENKTIEQAIKELGFNFTDKEKYVVLQEYRLEENYGDILRGYGKEDKFLDNDYSNMSALKISDYNKLRELNGQSSIDLKEDEVLITSNFSKLVPLVKSYMKENTVIKINNINYNIKNQELITEAYESTGFANNFFTVILPDKALENLKPYDSILNCNFVGEDREKRESEIGEIFKNSRDENASGKDFIILGDTKTGIYSMTKGATTTIIYIGIYIGIVFLISSAAVLALQQLSEASESIDRYKALRRVGASRKMINKTIFIQTLIYFAMPLVLAIIHSIVGISVANEFISLYGNAEIGASATITALLIIAIYGGYFYATYIGYKNVTNTPNL